MAVSINYEAITEQLTLISPAERHLYFKELEAKGLIALPEQAPAKKARKYDLEFYVGTALVIGMVICGSVLSNHEILGLDHRHKVYVDMLNLTLGTVKTAIMSPASMVMVAGAVAGASQAATSLPRLLGANSATRAETAPDENPL